MPELTTITVRDVDVALWRKFTAHAKETDQSVGQLLTEVLRAFFVGDLEAE